MLRTKGRLRLCILAAQGKMTHLLNKAAGKIHGLLEKTEQPKLAEVEVLNPTVLERRLCSLRLASACPSGYPTGRVQGLLTMAAVAYPVDT